jgi:hypothetical protein
VEDRTVKGFARPIAVEVRPVQMDQADVDVRLAEVLHLLEDILRRKGAQDSKPGEGKA